MIFFDNLWNWMDGNFAVYFCLVGGLIALALVLAIVPLLRVQVEIERKFDWAWGLLITAILAAGRWPSMFFPREVNPDETQMLAGAHALVYDPVFWRSVVGGTAGPLDFFALWPAGWLFGWHDYFTARITAFALLVLSLVLAHHCMCLILGRRVARVAGLAVVCLEALTNARDLLHYSTELLPVALLTVTAYAAIRRWVYQGGLIWNGLGGLLLGAVPLAKIQATPLAACAGLGWLLAEFIFKGPDTNRRRIYLIIGAILPMSVFACQLTIAGEWESFFVTYIVSNYQYAGQVPISFKELALLHMQEFIGQDSLLEFWFPMSLFWLFVMFRFRRIEDQAARIFSYLSFVSFLLALFCIIYPWHPYIHYWQLAVVPTTFLLGAVIGNLLATSPQSWQKRNRWLVAVATFSLVAVLLSHRANIPNQFLGFRAYFRQKSHSPHTELVERIKSRARPGDSIAIWGWAQAFFVETGLRQATRLPNFMYLIVRGPKRDYYWQRFLGDLLSSNPAFFLDATGPQNSVWKDPSLAHDQVSPALTEFVRANYILTDEIAGARLYQRRDLVAR